MKLTPVPNALRKFIRVAKLDNIRFEMNDDHFQDRLIVTGRRKQKQAQLQICLLDMDSVGEEEMLDFVAKDMRTMLDRCRKPKENKTCLSSS
jgi:hypothetical protein